MASEKAPEHQAPAHSLRSSSRFAQLTLNNAMVTELIALGQMTSATLAGYARCSC